MSTLQKKTIYKIIGAWAVLSLILALAVGGGTSMWQYVPVFFVAFLLGLIPAFLFWTLIYWLIRFLIAKTKSLEK